MTGLLDGEPIVITAGAEVLAAALADQSVPVTRVDWRSPVAGTQELLTRLYRNPLRSASNATAASRMLRSTASLVDIRPARDVIGLQEGQFLHAGPPIDWPRAAGPLRGALIGAVLLEGLATTAEAAESLLAAGEMVTLEPCHHRGGVGPMAGVVSPSMWVMEVVDEANGGRSWCTLNEGLGKVLRYGAYGPEVIDRLQWMGEVLGPVLQAGLRRRGPIDVTAILGQMVQMGDEGHNRNRAGTLMLLRDLLPAVVESGPDPRDVAAVARFVGGNDHFFLNLAMPACKLAADAARGVSGSSVVTAMARNGTDFGIQVAGTGDRWFTAPAETAEGLFLGAYGPADANPDIGDSAITETAGLGGFLMATAPAIVRLVGGSVADAMRTTNEMYEITVAENDTYALPILDFRGAPTGIDVAAVIRTGIRPRINTGIAGRVAGTGQVGAGLVSPPMACFTQALGALAGP